MCSFFRFVRFHFRFSSFFFPLKSERVNPFADVPLSHLDAVRAIAFHPTELCLATGGDDCTVKIWRMDVAGLASSACV